MTFKSSEDNNETTQKVTKSSIRSKYKHTETRKQKVKRKFKLRDILTLPVIYASNGVYSLPSPLPVPYTLPKMLSTYPFHTNYVYPVVAEWTPVIPVPTPVLRIQVPVVVNPVQIMTTQVCPYLGLPPQAISSPVLRNIEEIVTHCNVKPLVCYDSELHKEGINRIDTYSPLQYEHNYLDVYKEIPADTDDFFSSYEVNKKIKEVGEAEEKQNQYTEIGDPVEFYLTLPKDLFPAARTLTVDPNPIIDEFCKMPNILKHAPWILDLEFGVPNLPLTRPIPTYNVKLNSVSCKNAPDAIHPGFESCNQEFKDVFLFYYDCVVSTWYRGYIILNNDKSVENFQSWLLLPAQVFGMCWS